MAELPPSGVTVQLVRPPDDAARRATRLGIGLLVSLVVGWPPLSSAFSGAGAFEGSIIRFLVTVALSVGGVLSLGHLYDHFTSTGGAPSPAATATSNDPTSEEEHR